jgi:competence protein ComEA
MRTTPQERLALGVVALLLAAGVGARVLRGGPEAAALTGDAAALLADGGAASLRRAVADSVGRAAERAKPLAEGERIDPNTADADQLDRLPKVGPALAAEIVAHRRASGPFRSLADLDAVPGVGPAVLSAVAPHVTLRPGASNARSRAERPARVQTATASGAGRRVDLNRAGAEELAALPGIGPALARRIVEDRAKNGRFRGVDDLARVPGIGPRTADRLRPWVSP